MTSTASLAQIAAFRLRVDDVLITKDSETAGDIGIATYVRATSPDLVCGYHLAMLRPDRALLDGRYLYWFMSSTAARDQLSTSATGVTRFGLRTESIEGVQVPLPFLATQRTIADYLDTETARIDAHITKKQRLAQILRAREKAHVSELWEASAARWGTSRLGRSLVRMEQGWSPQCEDRVAEPSEFGVIKAGCVNGGQFRGSKQKALPPDTPPRLEYILHPGDLLVSRASGSLDLIGSAAVVPDHAPPNLLLCDKVYRLGAGPEMEAEFLALMLRAHPVREEIKLGVSGAEGMANSLPSGVVRSLPIPAAPTSKQREMVCTSRAFAVRTGCIVHGLERSITLLREHRQALITAAVTGELPVPRSISA